MTKDELNNEYFNWMCRLVYHEKYYGRLSHGKLLRCLHNTEFTCVIPLDENRAEDGIDLRYRFGYEYNHNQAMIASYLDDRPCSVLEMMIALAVRCEEHIMDNPDIGNRTGTWFWNMITNLGLAGMSNARFDRIYTDNAISRLLNRTYERDGAGGLFTVKETKRDLRTVEIWYQMCWYLDGIISFS